MWYWFLKGSFGFSTTDNKQEYVMISFQKPSKQYGGNTSHQKSDLMSLHPNLLKCDVNPSYVMYSRHK